MPLLQGDETEWGKSWQSADLLLLPLLNYFSATSVLTILGRQSPLVLVTLSLRVAHTRLSHSDMVSDWQPVACQWFISVVGGHGEVSVEEEETRQFIERHQRGSNERFGSFKSTDWLKSQRGWNALSLRIQVWSAEPACAHIVHLTRWWRSQWDKRSRSDEKKNEKPLSFQGGLMQSLEWLQMKSLTRLELQRESSWCTYFTRHASHSLVCVHS